MSCILVVDDEPGMGRLVELALNEGSVRVKQVSSVEEALLAIRTHTHRVVMLDLGLENEDGLTLLSRMRETASPNDPPVLTFTVHDSREREAVALGARGFVPKPFRAHELRTALESYLR